MAVQERHTFPNYDDLIKRLELRSEVLVRTRT
jgi:hypothetical protein